LHCAEKGERAPGEKENGMTRTSSDMGKGKAVGKKKRKGEDGGLRPIAGKERGRPPRLRCRERVQKESPIPRQDDLSNRER